MKISNSIYVCISIFLLLNSSGCKKFVTIEPPKNQLTYQGVFADSVNARAAVLGIYETAMQQTAMSFSNGGFSLYGGLSSDELYISGSDQASAEFFNYKLQPLNSNNLALWVFAYKYIYQCNASIEGLAASENIPISSKMSLIAELRFLRAFFYFNLLNLYGEVPIVTTTDYELNRLAPRAPADQVYAQIVTDLQFAQANLPANASIKARANFYSATALLAKVYLYTQQYTKSVTETNKIINSGKYTLTANINNVFLPGSSESIWYLVPVAPLRATWEGYYFIPSSNTTKPKYVIANTLYNSFENGDLRKAAWIKGNATGGVLYPYPYKYKLALVSGTNSEYSIIFRLAEIYLIRAEAKANSEDLTGATADLNVVRQRAGLARTTAADKSTMLLALEKERQTELFCEWCNRWFDLKRTGRAPALLGNKTGWNSNALLYPVPLAELNTNPKLTQNPGY
ncbi:RagB/SusD family nutrient uptake outer membrane protein [Mucilaginibacter sp. UYCu711]|uniref:RagB/SusD family nutrient uptake outer membrane protein n=1 Tax=Mucilaginibacter sp. UYCu711 TaxID=3156339 RepID=UPI003D1E996D